MLRGKSKWMVLLLSVLLVITACSSNNAGNNTPGTSNEPKVETPSNNKPTNEVVTIRTSFTGGELSAEQIAQFEALHPNIKIESDELDATLLAAQLATDSAPDVIRTSGMNLPSYVNRGIALDISDYIANSTIIDESDLLPVANVYRFDGTTIGQGPIYGLPKDFSNDYALFYNKAAFDAAGIPVPDDTKPMTWAEVLDLAKRLTIMDGDNVVQYGLAATEWGKTEPNYNFMQQYAASAGADFNAADNKSVNYDLPAIQEFVEMWVDAVQANVGPNSINGDQTSGGELFLNGKAAMIINGYWYANVIKSNEVSSAHLQDFGMLPTPTATGGKWVSATGGATGAFIYSKTKHPDEAFTFFEWFFGGEPAVERAKSGWGMPAFGKLMELLPTESEFDKQVQAVLQRELDNMAFLNVNPYLSGGWDLFNKFIAPLYFNDSSIDGMVQGLTRDANVVIKEALDSM